MAWWNLNKNKKKVTGFAEQDNDGQWLQYFNQYVKSLNNDKLLTFKDCNAYELACNVSEIFIPIDAIADRASSIKYKLVNKKTREIYEPKGNLKRLIESPNPFDTINDIVYKSVFSRLSDGNSYKYTKIPDSLKNPTVDNISNIWVLQPNLTKPILLKEITNPFLMKGKEDFIKHYNTFFLVKHEINPRYVLHSTALGINGYGIGESPLTRAEKNINNILAVYHARYNVYSMNGSAGILSRDTTQTNSLQEAVDPVTRDAILSDLQNRNGLTGKKNLIGISSIPLRYIKTLGTIKELEPFAETEANAIAIAGIFGVNKELISRNGSSTFTNQKDAEKGLWQNVVKSICEDEAKELTKSFYLPDEIEFEPDFSTVECLQEDKKLMYESDSILIDNLTKLSGQGQDVKTAYKNITDSYNGK